MKLVWFLLGALALWLSGVAIWISSGPSWQNNTSADVAMVLGAAVNDTEPSPVFQARIDQAIELYKQGRVRYLLFTGGLSAEDSLAESQAARAYAISRGVAEKDILIEERSETTHQNLVEAQRVMKEHNLTSAIIVSDPLHLRRALAMAKSLEMDATVSPARNTRYRSLRTQLPFLLRETYFIHRFWFFGE